jgi:hypothetical protein
MPKGYASITLKTDVARLLKAEAEKHWLGLNELLLKLLEYSPYQYPPAR